MKEPKREAAQGPDRKTPFSGRKRKMSSPIVPISGPVGPTADLNSYAAPGAGAAAFASELAASERVLAGRGEARRGAPPPEVLEQLAAAATTHEQLREAGHELRFSTDGRDGRVAIDLLEGGGAQARKISVSEALEIVAGKSPE
jgi:hypothetical protein